MGESKRDPHSGYMTTGHEWNDITELNTPVPKVALFFLAAATLFSLAYTIVMPAWPFGTGYTKGLLDIDQRTEVKQALEQAAKKRRFWTQRITSGSLTEVQNDAEIMRNVRQAGQTLFGDNCAACHGLYATGGPGYPNLRDTAWLWGGSIEAIAETIKVGVNSTHEDSRASEMLAFGKEQSLTRSEIQDVVSFVLSLSGNVSELQAERVSTGKKIFNEHCSDCHRPNGTGNSEIGAPDLTDKFWIYGGSRQKIYETVYYGRKGQMPQWDDRLSKLQRNILTLYIVDLGQQTQ